MQVPIDAWEGNAKKKRDDSDGASAAGRPTKARTLGGDRAREPAGPVRELRGALPGEVLAPSFDGANAGVRLEIPSVKTHISVRLEDKEDIFEGRNYEELNSLYFLLSLSLAIL